MTGIICMWHGLIVDIPDGWLLCDGTNGTPDLREKFVMGAPVGQNPGGAGGASSHFHTGSIDNHLHNHVASSSLESVTLDDSTMDEEDSLVAGSEIENVYPDGDYGDDIEGHQHDVAFDSEDHFHIITVNNATHNHNLAVDFENHLPPFYTLAFIMKT